MNEAPAQSSFPRLPGRALGLVAAAAEARALRPRPRFPPRSPSAPPPAPSSTCASSSSGRGAGVFYNQDKLPEGTLDVTMDWNNGDIPFSIYLTPANSCPDTTSLRNGGCQILAQSNDPKRSSPRRITYAVPRREAKRTRSG